MQNKKPFEIILHVGRVTSLQNWEAKKSCHCQTLIKECSIFDYPCNFEGIFLEKHSTLKDCIISLWIRHGKNWYRVTN